MTFRLGSILATSLLRSHKEGLLLGTDDDRAAKYVVSLGRLFLPKEGAIEAEDDDGGQNRDADLWGVLREGDEGRHSENAERDCEEKGDAYRKCGDEHADCSSDPKYESNDEGHNEHSLKVRWLLAGLLESQVVSELLFA